MLYGSETCAMRVEDMNRLVRAERMMVWSMCGVSLRDSKSSAELLSRLRLVSVSEVVEKDMLRWFGHVERKDVEYWVSRCRKLEVVGYRGRGRSMKSWQQCVDGDKRKHGMLCVDPWDRGRWRKCCRINRPTRTSMEK